MHRGETAIARTHTWSTRVVAEGLDKLSFGATYSEVGQWALRVTGGKRTRRPPKVDETATSKPKRKRSAASQASRRAWHIGADWVEAFAPVLYEELNARLMVEAAFDRARLNELIAAGKPLDLPQIIIVDDIPIYGRALGAKTKRRDEGFYVLVVGQVFWEHPNGDPFAVPTGTLRLRMVRAMAKSNTAAWRIVFDELGYKRDDTETHPDFIVADAGTGIGAAIDAHFDETHTKFIPSLWHLAQAVENSLIKTKIAKDPASAYPIPGEIATHMHKLSRTSGVLAGVVAWSAWWDELERLVRARKAPLDKLRRIRANYEAAFAEVISDIAAIPGLPVSSGGLETLMSRTIDPVLGRRRNAFANLERTNDLMDLIVCRNHNVFDDLGEVVEALRADASRHDGYAVPLRAVADPQPPRGHYSSLRDATLLNSIARSRGLA